MSQQLEIKFVSLDTTEIIWPDLAKKVTNNEITRLEFGKTSILEGGTTSGQTTVSFFLTDLEGKVYFAELTGRILCGLHESFHAGDKYFEQLRIERVKNN